jgi:Uma2 family endonuclease
MSIAPPLNAMALEDFIRDFCDEPFEWFAFDDEKRPWMVNVFWSSYIANLLTRRLNNHLEKEGLYLALTEAAFIITPPQTRHWVIGSRIPDVLVVEVAQVAEHKKLYPDSYHRTPFHFPPVLAVEVLSPSDSRARAHRKAQAYLEDGVQSVWIFDPEKRSIDLYLPDAPPQTLTESDTLNGVGALTGFSAPIAELWG